MCNKKNVKVVNNNNISKLQLASLPENLTNLEKELISFSQKLIETPSISGQEHNVSKLLSDKLIELGYKEVTVDDYGNVIGIYGEGDPKIMFNGHIDHVPPAGMREPYNPQIVDGARWNEEGPAMRGRGTCDMKTNVAAGAFAPAFLKEEGDNLKGSYIFVADVQEETDSPKGIPHLLKGGLKADFGISGESTELQVSLGHRGKVQFDIHIKGLSSHASNPDKGISAVYKAVPFLLAIEKMNHTFPKHNTYGAATITVTRISSIPTGDVAVVPSDCIIRIDRRYTPEETPESVQEELEALVSQISEENNTEAEVERINIYPLMTIDKDHPLVLAGTKSVFNITGKSAKTTTWSFGVNATFMSEAGIPCIGIGPGNEKYAHTPEEHVPISELIDSSKIYADLIKSLCDEN